MRSRALLGVAAALVVTAAPLAGQQASLFLGGLHTRYADTVSGSAGTIDAQLGTRSPSLWAQIEGSAARFTSGSWVAQANTGVLVVHSVGPRNTIAFRANANLSYIEGGTWSGITGAGPLVAIGPVPGWLLALGATGGGVRRIDDTSDPVITGSLRLSRFVRRWTLDFRVTGTWADVQRFGGAAVSAEYHTPVLAVGGAAGVRAGDLAGEPWGQLHSEWRVGPVVTLEAAVGTYPEDLTGFTSGFFLNAGIRLGRAGPASPPRREIEVEPIAPTATRVTFVVHGASTVDIAGEWNSWTPTPLVRAGRDRWQVVLPIGAGVYRFSLIVDGERWTVPEGVAQIPDDFGGSAGVLVVGVR